MFNSTPKPIPVKACIGGKWRTCGVLRYEDGRPVFEQKIGPGAILRKYQAAGVDLRYSPPLPENCLIRHQVEGNSYEIPLAALLRHPKAKCERVGALHPERCYLPYRYWQQVSGPQQMKLFAAGGEDQ